MVADLGCFWQLWLPRLIHCWRRAEHPLHLFPGQSAGVFQPGDFIGGVAAADAAATTRSPAVLSDRRMAEAKNHAGFGVGDRP